MRNDLINTVSRLIDATPPAVLFAFMGGCIVTAIAATAWVYFADRMERRAHAKRMFALSLRPRVSSEIASLRPSSKAPVATGADRTDARKSA